MKQMSMQDNNKKESQVTKLEKLLSVSKDEVLKKEIRRKLNILKQNKPVTK